MDILSIITLSCIGGLVITLIVALRCRAIRKHHALILIALLLPQAIVRAEAKNLAFEWVNFNKDGITASVRNEGDEIGKEEKVAVLFEWIRCENTCASLGKPYEWSIENGLKSEETRLVASKEIEDLKSWVARQPFGVQKVRLTLDPQNAIQESNEDDNTWEERPVSPKTPGKTLATRDAAIVKAGGELPNILPNSGLYVFKDIWKKIEIFISFNKEKKAEKRLMSARERLLEIEALVAQNEYREVEKIIRAIENDFEKTTRTIGKLRRENTQKGMALEARELAERVEAALALEDIEINAPIQYVWEIGEARKAILVGISRRIFGLQENVLAMEAIRQEVQRKNVGPFFGLRGLKLLGDIQRYYPAQREEKNIKLLERELVQELEDRITHMPEDIRREVAEYIANIVSDEESALRLLQRIVLIGKEMNRKEGEVARKALQGAEREVRGELRQKIEEKEETEEAKREASKENKEERKGEEGKVLPMPENQNVESVATGTEVVVCGAEFSPVCGKDDVTYSNECEAKREGVEIAKKGICELASPDLVIKDVNITPIEPKDKDWISVRALVANDGGTIQKLFYTRLRIDADINGIYDVLPNEYPLNLLKTSSSIPIAWENVWQAEEGVHRVELCVDSGKKIEESSEMNNCSILAFEVGPAPTSTLETSTSTSTSTPPQ